MRKTIFVGLAVFIYSIGGGMNVAFAACAGGDTTCATLQIQSIISLFPALSFDAGTPLNLGKVVRPASGSQYIDLTTGGSTAASTIAVLSGSTSQGIHTLTGPAGSGVNIKITGVDTLSNITLDELRVAVSGGNSCVATNITTGCTISPTPSYTFPGTNATSLSTVTINVGAKVTITSTATLGTYSTASTLGYTVTAEYN